MFPRATLSARNGDLRSMLISLHDVHYRVDEDVTALLLHKDFAAEAMRHEFYVMSYLRHRIPLLFNLALYSWKPQEKPQLSRAPRQPSCGYTSHHLAEEGRRRDENTRQTQCHSCSESDGAADDETPFRELRACSELGSACDESKPLPSSSCPASSAPPLHLWPPEMPEVSITPEQYTALSSLALQVLCGDHAHAREGSTEASTASCGFVWDVHTVHRFFEEHGRLVAWTTDVLKASCEWVEGLTRRAFEDQLIISSQSPSSGAQEVSLQSPRSGSTSPYRFPSQVCSLQTLSHHEKLPPQKQQPQSDTRVLAALQQASSQSCASQRPHSHAHSKSCPARTEQGSFAESLHPSCDQRSPRCHSPVGRHTASLNLSAKPVFVSPQRQPPLQPEPSTRVPAHSKGVCHARQTRAARTASPLTHPHVFGPAETWTFSTIAELEVVLELHCRRIRHAVMLHESLLVAVAMVKCFRRDRPVGTSTAFSSIYRDGGHKDTRDIAGLPDTGDNVVDDVAPFRGGVQTGRQCSRSHPANMRIDATANSTAPSAAREFKNMSSAECGEYHVQKEQDNSSSYERVGRTAGAERTAAGPAASAIEVKVEEEATTAACERPLDFVVVQAMHAFTHLFLSITAVQQRLQAYSHELRHCSSAATLTVSPATGADTVALRCDSWMLHTLGEPHDQAVAFSSQSPTMVSAAASTAADANTVAASSSFIDDDLSNPTTPTVLAARGTPAAYDCPRCQYFHQIETLILKAAHENLEAVKKSAIALVAHHSAIAKKTIRTIEAGGAVFASQATMLLAHVLVPGVLAAHPPGSRGGAALEWVLNYVFGGCSGTDARQREQISHNDLLNTSSSVDCFSLLNSSRSDTSTASRSSEASEAGGSQSDESWHGPDSDSSPTLPSSGCDTRRCIRGDACADASMKYLDTDEVDGADNSGGRGYMHPRGGEGNKSAESAAVQLRVEYILAACFTRCHPLMTVIGCVAENNEYNCGRTVARAVLQYAFTLSQTSALLLRTPLLTDSWGTPSTEAMMRGLSELASHAHQSVAKTPVRRATSGAPAGANPTPPMTRDSAAVETAICSAAVRSSQMLPGVEAPGVSSHAVGKVQAQSPDLATPSSVPASAPTSVTQDGPRSRVYSFVPPPTAAVTGTTSAEDNEAAQARTLRRCLALNWGKCILLSARTLTRAGVYDVTVPYAHYTNLRIARLRLRDRMKAYHSRMQGQFQAAHDEVRLQRLQGVFERWDADEQRMTASDAQVAGDVYGDRVTTSGPCAQKEVLGTPAPYPARHSCSSAVASIDLGPFSSQWTPCHAGSREGTHSIMVTSTAASVLPTPRKGGRRTAPARNESLGGFVDCIEERHHRAFVGSFCFGTSDPERLSADFLDRERSSVAVPIHVIVFTSLFSILEAMGDVLLCDRPRLNTMVTNELLTLLYEAHLSMLEPLHDRAMSAVARTASATLSSNAKSSRPSSSAPLPGRRDCPTDALMSYTFSPGSSPRLLPSSSVSNELLCLSNSERNVSCKGDEEEHGDCDSGSGSGSGSEDNGGRGPTQFLSEAGMASSRQRRHSQKADLVSSSLTGSSDCPGERGGVHRLHGKGSGGPLPTITRDGHILFLNEYALLLEVGLRSSPVVHRWRTEISSDSDHASRGYASLLHHLQQRQVQWAEATEKEYLFSRSLVRLMLGVTARDELGKIHGNVLHVDNLDIRGSRKGEVVPRLGVTSSNDFLATAFYSEACDPGMIEATGESVSMISPHATGVTITKGAVAAADSVPTSACVLPLQASQGERIRSFAYTGADGAGNAARDEDKGTRSILSDSPLVDVWSLHTVDGFTADLLDARHQLPITPSAAIAVPLPASTVHSSAHVLGRCHSESTAVSTSEASPGVAPLSLQPHLSLHSWRSFHSLNLMCGQQRMSKDVLGVSVLGGLSCMALTSQLSVHADFPHSESRFRGAMPHPLSPYSGACSTAHNSSPCASFPREGAVVNSEVERGALGLAPQEAPLLPTTQLPFSHASKPFGYIGRPGSYCLDGVLQKPRHAQDGAILTPSAMIPYGADAHHSMVRGRCATRVLLAGSRGALEDIVSRMPSSWSLTAPFESLRRENGKQAMTQGSISAGDKPPLQCGEGNTVRYIPVRVIPSPSATSSEEQPREQFHRMFVAEGH